MITVTAIGLDTLRAKLAVAAASVVPQVMGAMSKTARDLAIALNEAAPIGRGPVGQPIAGDGPGPLSRSFLGSIEATGEASFTAQVLTEQPTKLLWVRYGTGIYGPIGQRIFPRQASALRWVDADGIIWIRRSVAGMKPNDFVSTRVETYKLLARTDLELAAFYGFLAPLKG